MPKTKGGTKGKVNRRSEASSQYLTAGKTGRRSRDNARSTKTMNHPQGSLSGQELSVVNDMDHLARAVQDNDSTDIADLKSTVASLTRSVSEMKELLLGNGVVANGNAPNMDADVTSRNQPSGMEPLSLPLPSDCQPSNPLLTSRGIHPNTLPPMDIVTSQVRSQISSGKDVNLAALLIPGYSGDVIQRTITVGNDILPLKPLTDSRLNKSLTMNEFVKAFTIYTNVMCSAYPHRREELNQYLSLLVDMNSQFPGFGYFDYHKQFSAKAAAALAKGLKVDWGRRDTILYTTIFDGQKANVCNICRSVSHDTPFCGHMQNRNSNPSLNNRQTQDHDTNRHNRQGRPIAFFQRKQICNNFNDGRCRYTASTCLHAHVCRLCHDGTHAACDLKCGTIRSPDISLPKSSANAVPVTVTPTETTKAANKTTTAPKK